MSLEHRDYTLIKELYHCTPSELDEQEERILQLHFMMLMEERKYQAKEGMRAAQKARVSQLPHNN